MICPKCKEEMEYEEIKFPSGEWYCGECDSYYYGERIADFTEIYHETIGDENE